MTEQWLVHVLMLAVGVGVGGFTAAWKMRGGTNAVVNASGILDTRVHRIELDIIEIKLELKYLNRRLSERGVQEIEGDRR